MPKGKICKEHQNAIYTVDARVLIHQYVNEGIQQIKNEETEKIQRQQAIETNKTAIELEKSLFENADHE